MSNKILIRSFSGIAFIIIILGSLIFGSLSFLLLFSILIIVIEIEFFNVVKKMGIKPQILNTIFISLALFFMVALNALGVIGPQIMLLLLPLFFLIYIYEIFQKNRHAFTNIAYSIMGIFYIAVPFALMNYVVFSPLSPGGEDTQVAISYFSETMNNSIFTFGHKTISFDPTYLIAFFSLLWIYDTFAYLVGFTLGRTPLVSYVSPRKTWEGFWGGTLAVFLSAFAGNHFFTFMTLTDWLVLAFIITFFGTFGDLIVSLFKRSAHIKDSGKILPGHGGMLDRFDSFLIAAPVFFAYILMIK